MKPTVSVCVTAYQHARFIAQALDGVLAQRTSFRVEILVGEDESTDGTRDIVSAYARRHPDRVRAFFRNRRDVIYYDGRPTGRYNFVATLQEARGDFVAFLDGDDYWTDAEKLQHQVDRLHEWRGCALCFHRIRVVDEAGTDLGEFAPRRPTERYDLGDLVEWLGIPTSSAMIRRSTIPELERWYLGLPVGDWPLWILCARQGDIAYLDAPMAAHRVHPGGQWSGLSKEARWREEVLTSRALRRAVPAGELRRLDRRIAKMQGLRIGQLMRDRRPVTGLKMLAQSLRECRDDGRSALAWALTNAAAGARRLLPLAAREPHGMVYRSLDPHGTAFPTQKD
jgi:glycosyltransferase involved in cell wall biosynthesis